MPHGICKVIIVCVVVLVGHVRSQPLSMSSWRPVAPLPLVRAEDPLQRGTALRAMLLKSLVVERRHPAALIDVYRTLRLTETSA